MIKISQTPVIIKNKLFLEVIMDNVKTKLIEEFYIPIESFIKIDEILQKERKK